MENNPLQQILADVAIFLFYYLNQFLKEKSFVIPAKARIKKLYAFPNRNSEDKL
jgi:hypothetical protein